MILWLLALPLAIARRALRRLVPGPRRLGRCPGCLTTVYDDEPHVRYRGGVWHAEPCVEISAIALAPKLKRDH